MTELSQPLPLALGEIRSFSTLLLLLEALLHVSRCGEPSLPPGGLKEWDSVQQRDESKALSQELI